MSRKMNQLPSYRGRRLAGAGVALAGVVLAGCSQGEHTGSSSTSHPGAHTSLSLAPNETRAQFVSPGPDAQLSNTRNGIDIKFNVTSLAPGSTVFLTEINKGDGDRAWTIDGRTGNPEPVAVSTGLQSFPDQPAGNPGDEGSVLTLDLIGADPACAQALETIPSDSSNNYTVPLESNGQPELPSGCTILASTEIFVTW
jgi:hypothetical protein